MLPTPIIRPDELAAWKGKLRLLDARSGEGGRKAYAARHLTGAIHADLDRDLSSPTVQPARGGRHPLPSFEDWRATLGRWGIGPATPVVIYDDKGGVNAAARAWWMLRAVGHQPVTVLDGGWQAAEEAGLAVDDQIPQVEEQPPYPAGRWQQPLADLATVDRVRSDPAWRVVDVRAPERFRGEREPIDPVAGHIPGAFNAPCEENLDAKGRMRAPDRLAESFRIVLGDTPPERVIVHCGSGVTACHTLLALEWAGMRGASLYVGSWSEWCRSGRPRA